MSPINITLGVGDIANLCGIQLRVWGLRARTNPIQLRTDRNALAYTPNPACSKGLSMMVINESGPANQYTLLYNKTNYSRGL